MEASKVSDSGSGSSAWASTRKGKTTFEVDQASRSFNFRVCASDVKLSIWVEDSVSMKQWQSDELEIADFATMDTAIPQAVASDYALRIVECLKPTNQRSGSCTRSLSRPASDGSRLLAVGFSLQVMGYATTLAYTFKLKAVKLDPMDLLLARFVDLEKQFCEVRGENRQLHVKVDALSQENRALRTKVDELTRTAADGCCQVVPQAVTKLQDESLLVHRDLADLRAKVKKLEACSTIKKATPPAVRIKAPPPPATIRTLPSAATATKASQPRAVSQLPSSRQNPHVFFDIVIGGIYAGRLVFELFANVVPQTAENFRSLSTGERGTGLAGVPLHFKGSCFHYVVPGLGCVGGDIIRGDGSCGESIYGRAFGDENFELKHSERGILSMATTRPNDNNSKFMISMTQVPWMNGKKVVFGRVVAGMEVLAKMEAVGTDTGAVIHPIVVADCGQLQLT